MKDASSLSTIEDLLKLRPISAERMNKARAEGAMSSNNSDGSAAMAASTLQRLRKDREQQIVLARETFVKCAPGKPRALKHSADRQAVKTLFGQQFICRSHQQPRALVGIGTRPRFRAGAAWHFQCILRQNLGHRYLHYPDTRPRTTFSLTQTRRCHINPRTLFSKACEAIWRGIDATSHLRPVRRHQPDN